MAERNGSTPVVTIRSGSTHEGTVTMQAGNRPQGSVSLFASGRGAGDEEVERRYVERAEAAAAAAKEDRDEAESWARGTKRGVPVGSDDETYENNAMYYAGAAEGFKNAAQQAQQQVGQTIQTAGNTALQNIEQARQGALADMETKKQQVLDDIPDDYEAIQGEIDALQDIADGGLIKSIALSEDGESLIVTPVGGQPMTVRTGGLAFNSGYCALGNEEYGEDPEKWYLHLTKNEVDLPRAQFIPFEIVGGGGGGGGSSVITLTNIIRPETVRNGGSAFFSLTAESSDDQDITVRWSIDGAEITDRQRMTVTPPGGSASAGNSGRSGSTFTFEARNLLRAGGTSTVRARITSEGGGSLTRQWNVTSTEFSIQWGTNILPIMLYTANANVYAVAQVAAEAGTTNTVRLTVGENHKDTSVTGSENVTIEIPAAWFTERVNTVSAVLISGSDANDTSDTISYKAIWAYGATAPIVAFEKATEAGDQYDTIPIRYYVYDPDSETAAATLQIGQGTAWTVNAGREIRTYNFIYQDAMATETQQFTIQLGCGTATASMTVTITRAAYNIGIVTGDHLRYNLDPAGHTNTDANRESFGGIGHNGFSRVTEDGQGNETATAGEFDWVNGGFQTDSNGAAAFVIKKGYRATLPRSLFADSDSNGKTIDISFRIVNADEYGAETLRDLNNGLSKGMILRANEGELRMDSTSGTVFRYKEETRIDMSIHVEAAGAQRLATIWLDGIPSKALTYSTAQMLEQSEQPTILGSNHCDIWIYGIRCYNSALSEANMVQNYIASGSGTTEKVQRAIENAIYDQTGKITPASLHTAAPDLTIITIEAPRMTKTKKDPVAATVTIRDGDTVLTLEPASANDAKDGCVFKVQGTSSVAYARSALNMDIDFSKCTDGSGAKIKYRISENAIAVNYLNIKVNVASSENANNVCAVDWYNQFQPFLIAARQRNSSIRDTVEGKPCAVFFKNSQPVNGGSAVWVSSQLVQPQETILYVMGDLCNSKKNTDVFGQDGTGEHYTKACIEVSGNDTEEQRFRSTAAVYNDEDGEWQTTGTDASGNPVTQKHFEWRMEPGSADKAAVVQAWNDTVAWVVSTINDGAEFKSHFADYFVTEAMLYHFLMIEYFAAFDDVSKNTFYSFDWVQGADQSKWGGYRWSINKAYDWDTILAYDNDGKPMGDYGIDYGDTSSGKSYFNAVTNPIWVNIKAQYQSELSTLYIRLRGNGAWDGDAIAAKWDNYQARRPHAAMVRDAYVKYIYPYKTNGVILDNVALGYDNSYLDRLAGSKTYQRRQYLTYQTSYMDGKYGYYDQNSALLFRTNGEATTKNFRVKAYAKTYMTLLTDGRLTASQKVEAGQETIFQNVGVGNDTTLYMTPDSLVQHIRPLNETYNRSFASGGASKLQEIILGGETANAIWPAGTGIGSPSAILKDVSIRNLTNYNQALDLSANVELETLDTRGTQAGRITLPNYAPVTSLQLNAITALTARNLTKVETFTMESGANLVSVWAENCNSLVMNRVKNFLAAGFAAGGTATRSARLIGVDWELDDTTLLRNLLSARAIDAGGSVGDAPCVLTGRVHLPTIRQRELQEFQAAWPQLDIQYEAFIYQYPIYFWQDDWNGTTGTPIYDTNGNPYVQWVDAGQNTADPTVTGAVDMTDTRNAKQPDSQYTYAFDDWSSLPERVSDTENIKAVYTRTVRTYTVRWYNGVGTANDGNGTLIQEMTGVSYGACVKPDNDRPSYTSLEENRIYYVFLGWDRSTGFITGDTDVKATWNIGNLPSVSSGLSLNDMSWAQRSAVAKNDACERITAQDGSVSGYWEPGEDLDFTMGHDANFTGGNAASGDTPASHGHVESMVLVDEANPVYFDGTTLMVYNGQNNLPLIQLFNGSIERWTLAIDYEITSDSGALVSCFNDNGDYGFQLRRTGSYANTYWGSANQNVGYKYQRGILVLRYNHGLYPLVLYAAADGNTGDGVYPVQTGTPWSNIINGGMARATMQDVDAPLTLGGVASLDGSDVTSLRATGWIHWAKLWYDDLGIYEAEKIASFPHIPVRFKYTGIKYRDGIDSNTTVAGGFQMETTLPLRGVMNPTNTNVGGWDACARRKWLNGAEDGNGVWHDGQFWIGLPTPLQCIIQWSRVRATEGGGSSSTHALTRLNSLDRIYLPCYAEAEPTLTASNADNTAYVDECDDTARRIPHFNADTSRGMTSRNNARLRFCGFTVDNDAQYIVSGSDPTTPGLGYTVQHMKTIWANSNDSGRGYIFVSREWAARHKFVGGRLLTASDNKQTVGQDGNGNILGYWVCAYYWWLRSPYVTSSVNFWYVTSYGYAGYSYANYAYGLAPAFSI